MWKNILELSKNRTVDRVFKPKISDDQRISQRANWKRALARSGEWAQDESKGATS
jgi:glycerol kinase